MNEPLPEVPAEAIASMVARHVARAESYLALVRRHGSPLYVLDRQALRDRARRFSDAFAAAMGRPTRVYYAMKSNNCPDVAAVMVACGLGLDVSSGRELQVALDLPAESIIFSGPGKTDAELALAVGHAGRVTILIDSFSELARLEALASARGATVRAGVRLTVDPRGFWRKFGIPLADLGRFFDEADRCGHVDLRGLQFHTSWNLRPSAQTDFLGQLGRTLRALPARQVSALEFVDIGGGYWPESGEWLQTAATPAGTLRHMLSADALPDPRRWWKAGTPIEDFAAALAAAAAEHLPLEGATICLEPGRWLCNDGMHLLMRVVDRKAPDLVITDAGTNAVGWERFETDFFPVVNLTRPALAEQACDVHGCLCTPHDIWGYAYWGESIAPGDVLLVPSQGAYTYSLRQDFIKPIPPVVPLDAAE
ncbi:MAG: decarboxylase [Planctomycetes bacterium]|nr:decarboxylase [Planctomycetota bacterium]